MSVSFRWLLSGISLIAEYFLVLYFFRPLEKRKSKGHRMLGYLCLALIVFLYFTSEQRRSLSSLYSAENLGAQTIRLVYYAACVTGYLYFACVTRRLTAVYLGLYYSLFYTVSRVYVAILLFIGSGPVGIPEEDGLSWRLWYSLTILIVVAVEYLTAFCVHHFVRLEDIRQVNVFRLIFVAAANLLALYFKYAAITLQTADFPGRLLDTVMYPLLSGIFLVVMMIFFESYQASERERQELEKQKIVWNYELRNSENREKSEQNVRRIYHDMKNHLLAIKSMDQTRLKQPRPEGEAVSGPASAAASAETKPSKDDEITGYINSILRSIDSYEEQVRTGLPYMDAFLSEKIAQMKRRQVSCNAAMDLGKLDFISHIDLISLLGNALDNAAEAAARVPRPEERIIFARTTTFANTLILHIENTYAEPPRQRGGRFVTLKADREMHGIGMTAIEKTAVKYGGSLSVRVDEARKEFHLSIMIPVR